MTNAMDKGETKMSNVTTPEIDQDDAASRRFALLDLDDDKPSPKPVVAPAPEPTPAPVVRGVTVSETGAARAKADYDAAVAAGFSPRPPLYTIGTMVIDTGVENARIKRQEFEKLPFVDDGCQTLAERISAEARVDHLVHASDLSMLNDGRLQTPWNGAIPMTERAFEGLCTFTTPGGAGYLSACEPDLRALNLNRWCPRSTRLDKRALNRATKEYTETCALVARKGIDLKAVLPDPKDFMVPREVTLRTRQVNGKEEVFATTGPRYGKFDIDQIAKQIAQGCEKFPGARVDITYDGYKARFNIIFHSNALASEYVAGEIFRAVLIITTADDGSGSIKISAGVERNLCLNLIILDFSKLLVGSRRHIGTGESISADVQAHMEVALKHIGYFAQKWNEANNEDVIARYADQGVDDVADLFSRLVANRVVFVPGVKPDDMVQKLVRAFDREPNRTKAGILNAVTRAAHEEPWKVWTTEEDLERAAGEMLFAKVWNVQLPEEVDPFAGLVI
jgi:hypothetical protein